jgi:type I restriction enzyme S subunit
MFGDPLNLNHHSSRPISIKRLGQLAKIRTGKLDANASSDDGMYPFFTCAVETLRINVAAFDTKAILVAGNGDLNVKYYEGKFNAYQRTYVIESLDESIVSPRFLHGFLNIFVGRLREQAIGGVIKYIKLGMLTEAEVALPSIRDQEEYVARVEKIEKMRTRLLLSKSQLNHLFSSLQHRAFRGEL